jgi:hypothetical protein
VTRAVCSLAAARESVIFWCGKILVPSSLTRSPSTKTQPRSM